MNSSLFAFIFSGLFSGSIHAAHLTYILPSPPLLTERGDFSHLLTYAAGILSFRLHEYDDAPDFDTGHDPYSYKGNAIPSCLDDGSACSLTTDEYKMVLIRRDHGLQSYNDAPSQEETEYATLTVTTFSDSDIAQFALCDLITLHLREYLYVNIGEEENPDETGYILLDLNQLPVFSVVSAATDDDLSTFLSALTPKMLLEKIGPSQIWMDGYDVRRGYHYGRIVIACNFQRHTQACVPSDEDVVRAEAFVHPSLNSYSFPRRVLFLGPNPYLEIREILKYKSVEEVVVLGYDGLLFSMIETFMGDSYIGDLLENKRVTFIQEEPEKYLKEKAKRVKEICAEIEDLVEDEKNKLYHTNIIRYKFDIIFIHVPHMDHNGRIQDQYHKWTSYDFQLDVRELLFDWEDDGIVVINMGSEPGLNGVDGTEIEIERSKMLLMITEKVKVLEYMPISIYDELRAAPYDTSFIILFMGWPKSHGSFSHQNAGAITMRLASSLEQSDLPAKFYDGTTHKSYQRPSRAWEEWSCNHAPFQGHKMCTTYRPQIFNWRANSYNSTAVVKDDVKRLTLKATKFIPAGTFLNNYDPASSIYIDKSNWELLNVFVKEYPGAEYYTKLRIFIDEYGYETSSPARAGWAVSVASVNTFINHGCSKEQFKVGATIKRSDENYVNFSPLTARHSELLFNSLVAFKDIEVGEEILQDYSEFWDDNKKFAEFDKFHEKVCDTSGL